MTPNKIIVFETASIRRTLHNGEWYFSVEDIVKALTDSTDTKQYIKKMRTRDDALNSNWGTLCTPLPMTAADGKQRNVQTATAEGIFRIIQSEFSP
jgi:prophage antirepressor-like protein